MTKSEKTTAIVTGSSRGVGAATAIKLASKGWNVTITCSSSEKEAIEVSEECKNLGGDTLVIKSDVSEEKNCKDVVDQTIKKWGRLDALVNNAGTTKFNAHENLSGLTSEDFLRLYSVNTVGPYMMLKEAKSYLLESFNPSVVNVGSIAGVTGIGSSIAYASSKGALLNMTKSLARALGPIRVNAICPGFIQGEWLRKGMGDELYNAAKDNLTSSTPLKLTVTPEQVALGIYNFIEISTVVTGETMLMDGGHHLII